MILSWATTRLCAAAVLQCLHWTDGGADAVQTCSSHIRKGEQTCRMSGAQFQAEFHWSFNCFLTKAQWTERKDKPAERKDKPAQLLTL